MQKGDLYIFNKVMEFINTIPPGIVSDILSDLFNEDNISIRRCSHCHQLFPIEHFQYKTKHKVFGYYCKKCMYYFVQVSNKKPVPYTTCADRLTIDDEPIENNDGLLEVKCKWCKQHFIPNRKQVWRRIQALEYEDFGESSFYCSQECIDACPIYKSQGKSLNPSYQRDPSYMEQAKQYALERANHQCEICGSEQELHVHHINPVKTYPLEAYDYDNLIVLCKQHHNEYGHSDVECSTGFLSKICVK